MKSYLPSPTVVLAAPWTLISVPVIGYGILAGGRIAVQREPDDLNGGDGSADPFTIVVT